MPKRSISPQEAVFAGTVKLTTRVSLRESKANVRAVSAASFAKPCPCHGVDKRQPISTAGVKNAPQDMCASPQSPINAPLSRSYKAQKPHPYRTKCASIRSSMASDPSRVEGSR
jgi:hypothetical protein